MDVRACFLFSPHSPGLKGGEPNRSPVHRFDAPAHPHHGFTASSSEGTRSSSAALMISTAGFPLSIPRLGDPIAFAGVGTLPRNAERASRERADRSTAASAERLWNLQVMESVRFFLKFRRLFSVRVRHSLQRKVVTPVLTQENLLPSSVLLTVPVAALRLSFLASGPRFPICCVGADVGSLTWSGRPLRPLRRAPGPSAPATRSLRGSAPGSTPLQSAVSRRFPRTC
jgi:hypothetical protein